MLRMLLAFLLLVAPAMAAAQEPIVSLRYRGDGADLAGFRAMGFSAITVAPQTEGGARPDALRALAERAGLRTVVGEPLEALTATSALMPGLAVEIGPQRRSADALWPLAWRAIAHGARVVTFDPESPLRSGGSLATAPSLVVAGALARQLRANGALFSRARPGPGLRFEPPAPEGLDVALLDAQSAWVLVATNLSADGARGTAHLPAAVPYAMWLNLLEGTTMAMLEQPAGPTWVFGLDPWDVKIYVIDKALK
jgi:hypothetical protein